MAKSDEDKAKENSTESPSVNVNVENTVNNNSSMTRVVGIVVAVLVGLGLIGILRGEDSYSEEVRNNYVTACVEQSGEEELCGCTYDRLASQITFDEFKALDERANNGETTEEDNELITGVAFACVAELQGN